MGLLIFSAALRDGYGDQITCRNNEVRERIDVSKLSITYSGMEMVATLGRLAWTGVKVDLKSTTLQSASAATQQWNEYLKGLAVSWNACIVTKEQYFEALNRLVPQIQADAKLLDSFEKGLSSNEKVDQAKLEETLRKYLQEMRRFAEISRQSKLFDQIVGIAEDVRLVREEVSNLESEQRAGFADLRERLEKLIQQSSAANLTQDKSKSVGWPTTQTEHNSDDMQIEASVYRARSNIYPTTIREDFSQKPWRKLILNQEIFRISHLEEASRLASNGQRIGVAVVGELDSIPSYFGTSGSDLKQVLDFPDGMEQDSSLLSLIAAIAPNADLIPVSRVEHGEHGDNIYALALLDSIALAEERGARVILLPFVYKVDPPGEIWNEIIRRVTEHGILVIAAAGNSSESLPSFPNGVPGVLSVASVDQSGALSKFSAHGDFVSISAPGDGVTVLAGANMLKTASGTSFSAAVVAGTAALILGLRPDLSPEHLTAILRATVVPLDQRSPTVGQKILDARAAVIAAPELWR